MLNVKTKKSRYYKTVNRVCVKDVKIYFIGLKKDLFGCFRIEEIRDKDNETGLKEGGGIEMSTTVLPFTITIITIYYSDTINSQT